MNNKPAASVPNSCLQGFTLSCKCFDNETQRKLLKVGEQLGAKWQVPISRTLTCLLVDKAGGSEAYFVASKLRIPIIKYRWLYDCFRQKKFIPWDLDYLVPPFWRLTIVSTGFPSDKRQEFKATVSKHGGIYKEDLILDESTHLIAYSSKSTKYEVAKEWGWDKVKIVNDCWITDCAKESSK